MDQRLIDDMVGHQTEEQRRRYRHLYPNVQQDAIRAVFGDDLQKKWLTSPTGWLAT